MKKKNNPTLTAFVVEVLSQLRVVGVTGEVRFTNVKVADGEVSFSYYL